MRKEERYHYTESGLDNVYLVNGFEYADNRKTVIVQDIDGLQRAIGLWLAREPRRLTGKEFRFLRSELLLSQASLAKVLGVKELTIGRWERGETDIPLSSEAIVRLMFLESQGEESKMKEVLERLADLEDAMSRCTLTLRENRGRWAISETQAA